MKTLKDILLEFKPLTGTWIYGRPPTTTSYLLRSSKRKRPVRVTYVYRQYCTVNYSAQFGIDIQEVPYNEGFPNNWWYVLL